MLTMTVSEAKNNFDKLIELATHEPVTITKLNRPIVVIHVAPNPVMPTHKPNLYGSMKGTFGSKEQIDANIRQERDAWDN